MSTLMDWSTRGYRDFFITEPVVKEWIARLTVAILKAHDHLPARVNGASLDVLGHFVGLFARSGVHVVFNGHEHNFQFSARDQATGGVCYVISGAGGQLRPGNVTKAMAKAHIAGWAAQNHFLVAEIRDDKMPITPVSTAPVKVSDPNGKTVALPLEIRLRR